MANSPHPSPLPASGEREGPAKREGEGQQATGLGDSLMQVRRLRLVGFKSFVDATEVTLEPGLTGIVGPNGCGKSNLVEALRWVMGETSARRLRGGEMDDVIFAGT